jgi:hypothetical protein
MADEFWGDPQSSSLKLEGQGTWYRPGTDVYLVGQAHAPGGQPTIGVRVRVRVGPVEHRALVIGNRQWRRRLLGGVEMSEPEPFLSLPLVWERAFGGTCSPSPPGQAPPLWEPRNPVGRGLYPDSAAAEGQFLPNLERENQRISRLADRPVPVGFGPVARHWEPRRPLGGTYDQRWVDERAPYWPDDLDERFFCAAPQELQSPEFLRGGEPVELEGLHPNGFIRFFLPRLTLSLRTVMGRQADRRALSLDGVALFPDEGRLTLYHRAAVPAPKGVLEIQSSCLRQLEPWEVA